MPHRYNLTREIFEDTIKYLLFEKEKIIKDLSQFEEETLVDIIQEKDGLVDIWNEHIRVSLIDSESIDRKKEFSNLIDFLIEQPFNLGFREGEFLREKREKTYKTIYFEILFERKKMNFKEINYKNKRTRKREEKLGKFYNSFEVGTYNGNQLDKIRYQLDQVNKYDPNKNIRQMTQELIEKIDSRHTLGNLALTDPSIQGALSHPKETGLAIVEPIEPPQKPKWYQRLREKFN
jgi:hypothetical protein